MGTLLDAHSGEALAWQLETSAGWHADLSQARDGGSLALLGPCDLEHQFAHELRPGEKFAAVPVAMAVSPHGRDGAIAELTAYRRWLTGGSGLGGGLPLIYNDFMNTLMGQPTTEQLLPLIDAAAQFGVEVFCIDAGWFADSHLGDWWATVGEWREASGRFTGGFAAVIAAIHDRGMRVGLWLEPEVVGASSPLADELPNEAFFQRHGHRVREHDRYHLDFRHPAARAHLDEVVDRMVDEYGMSYLKLDYNINPGAGTDLDALAAGDGLLAHTRAYREWLVGLQERHPQLTIENCASGAMRADYSLLSVTSLQSTSDQQDFRLYPPVAASAPAAILPEQCGNWAYPHRDMSDEETAFTLVTGLSGRLYLSGFLYSLRDTQIELVREACGVYLETRDQLAEVLPYWPLGIPAWDDDVICLGYRSASAHWLFVWDRTLAPNHIVIPDVDGTATQYFPRANAWATNTEDDGIHLHTPAGYSARVFRVETSA